MVIHRAVLDAIVRHARDAAPNECCGLLLGRGDQLEEAVRTRNAREGPTTFQVDPADHFAVIRRGRTEGREVLGAYHSHPRNEPIPSATDLAEAHDDAFLHVIVSLAAAEPRVRAFRLTGGTVIEVPLSVRRATDGCGRRA